MTETGYELACLVERDRARAVAHCMGRDGLGAGRAQRDASADARRRRPARRRQQSRSRRSCGSAHRSRPRASARARRIRAGVLDSRSAASSNVTPPSNFLLGERGVDTTTGSRRPACGSGSRGAAGTWSVSWDASRTTTNSPLSSFDPEPAVGLSARVFAAAAEGPQDGRGATADTSSRGETRRARSCASASRSSRPSPRSSRRTGRSRRTLANVTVQQRSLELAQELARQNKARVDVGQTPPLDLVQAEAEVAQRRENLIRANAAAEDAEDRLRRLIMDPDGRVVLAGAPRPDR